LGWERSQGCPDAPDSLAVSSGGDLQPGSSERETRGLSRDERKAAPQDFA
jgi:hypothetical protein